MGSRVRWFYHPVFVFVFSIIALSLSLFLYIYWYVEVSSGLLAVVRHYHLDPKQFLDAQAWVVILVLSLLMAAILAGTIIIFLFGQKMVRLYSLQRDFINNFTHELKTPATSLKLYLETFLKHDLPREEQQKFLGYMLKDVNRITETIGSILNLARIETRTYSAELETVDLVETVARFYEQGGHLFPKGGIQIHNPSGAVYPSSINPVLFDMLLMNLTANAFKYNESDRPSLDIFFEKEKNRYRIRFEDNGIGIPKGEHKNIFKKFYQVDTGDSGSAKGSGLGLYLVHQIARIHGGEVTATDRKDVRGAVFVLHLPGCRTKPKTGGQG